MNIQDIFQMTHNAEMRLAKRIARSGVCSRRDAEKRIENGTVTVNGHTITQCATTVTPNDSIAVDGKTLPDIEPVRLWAYHKPTGVITTNRDALGRKTIYDTLPPTMPRVMSIGRLDLNSEGLLLLTNDGDFARALELPKNAWMRTYRVRIHGTIKPQALRELENGITINGIQYGKIIVEPETEQTASNVWIRVTLSEGKNREIRRVMNHLGYKVSRLIRIAYGPFSLHVVPRGDVQEITTGQIRQKILKQKPKKTWAKAKPKRTKPNQNRTKKLPTTTLRKSPEGKKVKG